MAVAWAHTRATERTGDTLRSGQVYKDRKANNRSRAKPQTCCFYDELHAMLCRDHTTSLHNTNDTSEEPKSQVSTENSKEEENGGQVTAGSRCIVSKDLFLISPQSSPGKPNAKEGTSGKCVHKFSLTEMAPLTPRTEGLCLTGH